MTFKAIMNAEIGSLWYTIHRKFHSSEIDFTVVPLLRYDISSP